MTQEGEAANQIRVRFEEFEGPLDLLLHLIHKNQIDIYDIPIAEITDQYLKYLETMRQLDLEVASEFLVIASTLILIKSKMLLPKPPAEEEEEEDPRAELVQRLLEYQAVREAAENLRERGAAEDGLFRRELPLPEDMEGREDIEIEVSLFELMDAFKELIDRTASREEVVTVRKATLSVTERMGQILEILSPGKRRTLNDLFTAPPDRPMVVVTFLALLELLHRQMVKVYQSQHFGPLYLRRIGEEK